MTHFLRRFDFRAWRGLDNRSGRLWITPYELRITRTITPHVVLGRSEVTLLTSSPYLFSRRLDTGPPHGLFGIRKWCTYFAADHDDLMRALQLAGWPIAPADQTTPSPRIDASWHYCKSGYRRGWLIVSRTHLTVEMPTWGVATPRDAIRSVRTRITDGPTDCHVEATDGPDWSVSVPRADALAGSLADFDWQVTDL